MGVGHLWGGPPVVLPSLAAKAGLASEVRDLPCDHTVKSSGLGTSCQPGATPGIWTERVWEQPLHQKLSKLPEEQEV